MSRRVQMLLLSLAGALLAAAPAAIAQGTANPHGANIGACTACHAPDKWKPVRIAATYKHAEKTFPLNGGHLRASCTSCHKTLDFARTPTGCASCHTDAHHGEVGSDCARCHTTRSYVDLDKMRRTHETTRFPLRGAHATAQCASCHTPTRPGQAQFASRPTACASCHTESFRATKAPDHVAAHFSTDCAQCHTAASWSGASFDHSATRFALAGAHKAVSCEGCHADKVFTGKPTACASCHQASYNNAVRPPHASLGFSTTCATCHTEAGWKPATYDHSVTRFALTGAHRAVSCAGCHADGVYRGKPAACATCHQAAAAAVVSPSHGGFPVTCEGCHGTASWKGAAFNHATTQFPLTGAHLTTTCTSCHGDGVYKGKPTTCVSCHQTNFNASARPPHSSLGFSTTCLTCHTTAGWRPATYDHSVTRFALTGAHLAVSCAGCHADGVYRGKPMLCASCHQSRAAGVVTPPHAGFPSTCESCHGTASWKGGAFNHSATQFPLTGAHVTIACTSCHSDGVYKGKPTACVSCHQTAYNGVQRPPHSSLGFSTTCLTCHTTAAWKPATYNHSATRFPLTGAHLAVSCAGCHADGVYRGKPMLCASCHQSLAAGVTTPSHSGFPTTCESCHGTASWKGASFNHSVTQFPLTGAHVTVTCMSCHADGVYKGKPTACVSCHQTAYNGVQRPPHSSLGFSTTCLTCHTTAAWKPATYNHSATRFPLTGAHLAVTCAGCHADGVYRGKPMLCASCHQSLAAGVTTPSHSGFPTTCESCHSTSAWKGASFNHSVTQFPLTGAHVTVTCMSCHADGVYKGKSTACVSCHQTAYNGVQRPPHSSLGFSTTCLTCHTTAAWKPATYNHSTTRFPLTGAHLATSCNDCHADGVYRGKSMLCASCHIAKYNTAQPPHAGFPTTCESCHSAVAWKPATFNHANTRFPLTGAHVTASCSGCHGDGVYHGKTMVCSGCHLTKYNATTNPNHTAAHFPTTCESCHNTTAWPGATFNHDQSFFPIYSGSHQGKWTTCANCHTVPTDFAVFTCTNCHTKAQTDPKHQGKSGYSWDSIKCYACHPRGRAG